MWPPSSRRQPWPGWAPPGSVAGEAGPVQRDRSQRAGGHDARRHEHARSDGTRHGGLALVVAGALMLTVRGAEPQSPRRLQVITSAVYKRSFDQFVVPRMKELYGVEVAASPFLSAETLAKAIAQKDSPQTSVFMLDEGPWLQGKEAGLWEALDSGRIPNLRDVPAQFGDRDGRGTPLMLVLLGVIYDETALRTANVPTPTSVTDLWNPALRDRVSIQQFSSTFAFALLAHTTRLQGGDPERSFDPGFERLKQLRPNVRTFSGPAAQLIQLFQQKEIWMAWGGHFTAMQAAAAGAPVRWGAPREGAMGYAHYMAIARGAPNLPDAERLINLMLSPEYQKVMAETDFMGPVNPKTRLSAEFARTFPVTVQAVEASKTIPWLAYNRNRVALNERWQREVEQ